MWVGACFHIMVLANSEFKKKLCPTFMSPQLWLLEMPSQLLGVAAPLPVCVAAPPPPPR